MKQLGVCSMIVWCLLALPAESATATWDRNPEPDVLGYVLAYGTASGVYTTEINVGNVLSYEFFSPPGYRYYLVVRAYNAMGVGPDSNEVVLDLTTPPDQSSPTVPPAVLPAANVAVPADYDGDQHADIAVYRPSTGIWNVVKSSEGVQSTQWGEPGDVPIPADYDGDRRADIAVFRPSNGIWYVVKSSEGVQLTKWGEPGDVPIPADYDGDQRADIAVYLPSDGLWYVVKSSEGVQVLQWGEPGDVPVPADYDGDRRADIAVYRPSNGSWYVLKSGGGAQLLQWGDATVRPMAFDYDADGSADLAILRGDVLEILLSSTGYTRSVVVP